VSQAIVGRFVKTFNEFPAVQKPNTFTVDDALEKLSAMGSGGG
jgi:arylsulfatase